MKGSQFSKIPRFFQDFSRFLVNFQVFFIISKVTSKFFWSKIYNFIVFHVNKKLTISTIIKIKKPSLPAYFSNLEGSALVQHQDKKQEIEYFRPTQFFQVSYYFPSILKEFSRCTAIFFQDFPGYVGTLSMVHINNMIRFPPVWTNLHLRV